MIQLCLAEKDKASIQRCFPLQNRECGIKRGVSGTAPSRREQKV